MDVAIPDRLLYCAHICMYMFRPDIVYCHYCTSCFMADLHKYRSWWRLQGYKDGLNEFTPSNLNYTCTPAMYMYKAVIFLLHRQ